MKIFFEWQGRKTKGAVAMHLVIQAPQWPPSVFTCSGLHSKPRFLSLWLLAVFECTCIYCLSFSWPLYQKYHIKEAERGTEVGEEGTQRSQQRKKGLSKDWGHCRCFFFLSKVVMRNTPLIHISWSVRSGSALKRFGHSISGKGQSRKWVSVDCGCKDTLAKQERGLRLPPVKSSFVFICSLLMVYFAYSSSFSSLSASLLVWVFLAGPVFPQHPGEVQVGCVCHGLDESWVAWSPPGTWGAVISGSNSVPTVGCAQKVQAQPSPAQAEWSLEVEVRLGGAGDHSSSPPASRTRDASAASAPQLCTEGTALSNWNWFFFFSKKTFFPSDHFSLLLHPAAPVPLLYIQ